VNALTPATNTAPAAPAVPEEPSLAELTAKIRTAHEQLRDSMKYIVNRAISIGDDLNLVKIKVGHGLPKVRQR
jgi:hypothetical protein